MAFAVKYSVFIYFVLLGSLDSYRVVCTTLRPLDWPTVNLVSRSCSPTRLTTSVLGPCRVSCLTSVFVK